MTFGLIEPPLLATRTAAAFACGIRGCARGGDAQVAGEQVAGEQVAGEPASLTGGEGEASEGRGGRGTWSGVMGAALGAALGAAAGSGLCRADTSAWTSCFRYSLLLSGSTPAAIRKLLRCRLHVGDAVMFFFDCAGFAGGKCW